MQLSIWQIDAFTKQPFSGNPAAVCVLKAPLPDAQMQQIAAEMNLSETAFIELREGKDPLLCWFTPTREIDLCGHATLSAAHVLFAEQGWPQDVITFDTRFVGRLRVQKQGAQRYQMRFPARAGEEVALADIPKAVTEGLGISAPIIAARKARDLMLVFEDAAAVRLATPDFNRLMDYEDYLIITAPSDVPDYDFISRFFCADDGIAEDPVTGSAHCTLAPYWAKRLGKNTLRAYQASKRGGELDLELARDYVIISGDAITVLTGALHL